MMKRFSLLILMAMIVLVSCEKKAETTGAFQDGNYSGTYQHFDGHGWKPTLDITVEDGVITQATWDYVNAQGEMKSQNTYYADAMESRSGTTPAKAAEELQNSLIEGQSADVDTVSGATHSTENFRELAAAVLANAAAGNTSEVKLPMNATYHATEPEPDQRGWTASLSVTFEDNQIVAAEYMEVDADGNSKADNPDYTAMMEEQSGTTPAEAAQGLVDLLISSQDANVDDFTGATSSSSRFRALAVQIMEQR